MKRLLELKEERRWTDDEYARAEAILGQPLPFYLHSAGMSVRYRVLSNTDCC